MKKYQMPLVEVALLSSSMDQMQTGGGSPGEIQPGINRDLAPRHNA